MDNLRSMSLIQTGVIVACGTLMNSGGGSAFTLDPAQKVLEARGDFVSDTIDVIIQGAKGALSISEFNSSNERLIKTVTLVQFNAAALFLAKDIGIEATGHTSKDRS
jgi:hypothetical protein